MSLPSREESIFAEALEKPLAERRLFLDQACAGDAALRTRVEALLAASADAPAYLDAAAATRPMVAAEERPGDNIGRYRLLQQIGEGGCGIVYMAEQEEPVRRRVALKVIKLGMDTKAVVARFEAERQALAMMDHPNIAKVHDAGATETGRPFFVMELVRGIPITKYSDENHLTPAARLELFIKVCHAIQHAHQKGIIHRDIKPSNILVTVNDGQPTPKVIDFGIAKATQGRLTDATVFTAFEQFIGTPVYMSPEQAEMSSLDIDTRSDIYSLGVLLYELLTGKPPFDPKAFAQAGVEQIRRQIREVEPPRPSARLKTLDADERTTIARLRGTVESQLTVALRGDLDWIIMRCLEKDRMRRYDTANGLAMDIQRYLRHEPVVARPPSTTYLLQKLVRRHRVGFSAAAMVAVILIVAVAVSTWQALLATRAKRSAIAAQQNEAGLRHAAEAQELAMRRRAYVGDIKLAQQALAVDNLGRAQHLLERQRPTAGRPDLRGWEWRYLWQFCQGAARQGLGPKRNWINSVAVSADGQWLAAGEDAGGQLSLWNIQTREEQRIPAGDRWVKVAFSPRAPLLAIATVTHPQPTAWSCRVLLWHVLRREVVRELTLSSPALGLQFSADGEVLFTSNGSQDATPGEITQWAVDDGRRIATHRVETLPQVEYATPFTVSRDSRSAAYGGANGRVHVIDLETGRERWSAKAAHEHVLSLAFSRDDRMLASGAGHIEGTVCLWDAASGRPLGRLEGHRNFTNGLIFLADGKSLASASGDQTIRIWDLEQRVTRRTLRGHRSEILSLALLPDESTLATAGKDGWVHFWNSAGPAGDEHSFTVPVNAAAWRFAADSKALVTIDGTGQVVRWRGARFERKEILFELGPIALEWLAGPVIDPGGARCAAGTPDGRVKLVDCDRGVLLHETKIANEPVYLVAVASGGDRIYVRTAAELIEWEVRANRRTRSWSLPGNARYGVPVLSPDEKRCLLFSDAGRHLLIDLSTGRETVLPLKIDRPTLSSFSPDGRLAAIGSRTGSVHLWELSTQREMATLPDLMFCVMSATFSPDGHRLVVGNNSAEGVSLWEVESREELLALEMQGSLYNFAFSPDGNLLAGGSRASNLLQVWRAPSWTEIAAVEIPDGTRR